MKMEKDDLDAYAAKEANKMMDGVSKALKIKWEF